MWLLVVIWTSETGGPSSPPLAPRGVVAEVPPATPQAPQLSEVSLITLNVNRRLVEKLPSLSDLLFNLTPNPHVVFLQEAGLMGSDPPGVLSLILHNYHIFIASSPEQSPDAPPFRASLVTLVAKSLVPDASAITVRRAPNGTALILQVGKLLLANTYLPAGLDWATTSSDAASQARATYDWLANNIMTAQEVGWVLAGDFNETTVPKERLSSSPNGVNNRTPSPRRGRFILDFLQRTRGVDISNGVHTFRRNGSSSLLDRILISEEFQGGVLNYEVTQAAHLSDHSLVHLRAFLPIGRYPRKWQWTQKKFIIPTEHSLRLKAHERANSFFKSQSDKVMQALRLCTTSAQLEEASLLFAETLKNASKKAFRTTDNRNRKPFRSRLKVTLNDLKNNLVQLARLCSGSHPQPMAPALLRKVSKSARLCFPHLPSAPGLDNLDLLVWIRYLLNRTRHDIKDTYRNMRKVQWDDFARAPHVSVFARKIIKQARPPPITSVPHPVTGIPTSDPDIIKQQLLLRVTEPMRREPVGPHRLPAKSAQSTTPEPGLPDWYQEIYSPVNVGDAWQGLCDPPSWKELRELIGNAKKHTSPGEGALGIDLLQCCVQPDRLVLITPGPIAIALVEYVSAVLRVGVYPAWTCCAWVTTIDKGSKDPLDVRPISVLPELYRLISRVLNARLLSVFRKRNILHPAQRAGLSDGDFLQCLDVLTSIIEDRCSTLALVLYDQAKAFDLVTPLSIERACLRLSIPAKFISLVTSAMQRALAKVRTAFGLSEAIKLCRSLRQGDPLASILYCIYIDPLHCLLERLGGYQFADGRLKIASAGFMDDTAVAANSFADLIPLHECVVGFSLLNDGALNNTKSRLLLRDYQGPRESRVLHTPAGPIIPVGDSTTVRYLGLWVNLALNWETMDNRIKMNFWRIFYIIKNNRLPTRIARLVINLWLLPVFRQGLRLSRYVSRDGVKVLGDLQKVLNTVHAKNAGCPQPRNWSGPITSVLFNTKDLVQNALGLNIEALHLNLNLPVSIFPSAAATRSRLATHLAMHNLNTPAQQTHRVILTHSSSDGLLSNLNSLRQNDLKRSLQLQCDMASKLVAAWGQGLSFLDNPLRSCNAQSFVPSVIPQNRIWEICTSGDPGIHPTADLVRTLLFDEPPAVWDIQAYEVGWITDLVELPPLLTPEGSLSVYTDGSAKIHEDAGAAAIFFMNNRKLLTIRTRLRGSKQSFFPECVGCLLAVKFAPLNVETEVICDCRSALFVAPKPAAALSWKKRLTTAGRPALECIRSVISIRTATVHWRWVRAHTNFSELDLDAANNSQVDRQAKAARGLIPSPPIDARTWNWGAEQAILTTMSYPTVNPSHTVISVPRHLQVMGSVKEFLDRLQRVNLAKEAAKATTMGKALRYNGDQVLRVVELLTRFASSETHAMLAMAIASYLPLANRRSWSTRLDPNSGSCDWCAAGVVQNSPHIFNCPRLMRITSAYFIKYNRILQLSQSTLSPVIKSTLGSVVSHVDALRDCLALDLMNRTSDLAIIPLALKELADLPHSVLVLASNFARHILPYSRSHRDEHDETPRVCIAAEWRRWTTSFRLLIECSRPRNPDSWNSAPHPALWCALQNPSLPAPFHAVIFNGTPALPPPPNVVWYTTNDLRPNTAWWANHLTEVTTTLRLFDWAPFLTAKLLRTRAQLWMNAIVASHNTIIWAVVPAFLNLSSLQTLNGLICLESSHFSLQLVKPSDPQLFWIPQSAGSVQVKSVLLFSVLIAPRKAAAWSTISHALPHLLQGVGSSPHTETTSSTTHAPAGWWWGPTRFSLVHPNPHAIPILPLGTPSACSGDTLCRATCSSALLLTKFSRYFGNLGIPPSVITELFSEAGPSLLEGDREPPAWIDETWRALGRLMKIIKTLK